MPNAGFIQPNGNGVEWNQGCLYRKGKYQVGDKGVTELWDIIWHDHMWDLFIAVTCVDNLSRYDFIFWYLFVQWLIISLIVLRLFLLDVSVYWFSLLPPPSPQPLISTLACSLRSLLTFLINFSYTSSSFTIFHIIHVQYCSIIFCGSFMLSLMILHPFSHCNLC